MIIAVVICALLLLANALFVAAEFAVVAAPRTAVEHKANEGDPLAKRLLVILTSPLEQDRYIATAQLGITLASLGLGMYGEHTLATWFEVRLETLGTSAWIASHLLASILAISILTYFHIFIGEMIPKAIALGAPERTARAVYGSMRVVLMVLYPFVYVLNAIGNRSLALFGVHRKDNAHEQLYTPRSCRSSSRRASAAGHSGPRRARFCASCSSSVTARWPRSWCRACGSRAFPSGPRWRNSGASCSRTGGRGMRSTRATSITSSACCTSRTCCDA